MNLKMNHFCHFKFSHSRKNHFCCKWIPFLGLDSKVYLLQKKKLFSSYPLLKPSLPMKRRKKNCLGAAKWKKSLVIMEKKRNSFTLEKLLIYFFLQIKFAFRKDPPNFQSIKFSKDWCNNTETISTLKIQLAILKI